MSTHPGARSDRPGPQAASGPQTASGQIPNRQPAGSKTSVAVQEDGATAELAAAGSSTALRQRSLRPGTQLSVVCEHLDASGCGVARCTDTLPQGAPRDATVTVLWPEKSANECAAWLREYLRA